MSEIGNTDSWCTAHSMVLEKEDRGLVAYKGALISICFVSPFFVLI